MKFFYQFYLQAKHDFSMMRKLWYTALAPKEAIAAMDSMWPSYWVSLEKTGIGMTSSQFILFEQAQMRAADMGEGIHAMAFNYKKRGVDSWAIAYQNPLREIYMMLPALPLAAVEFRMDDLAWFALASQHSRYNFTPTDKISHSAPSLTSFVGELL